MADKSGPELWAERRNANTPNPKPAPKSKAKKKAGK